MKIPRKATGDHPLVTTINQIIDCLHSLKPIAGPGEIVQHTTRGVVRKVKPQRGGGGGTTTAARWA